MHFKFSVSAVKHTVSIGNIDLYFSCVWLEPKTGRSRAMPGFGNGTSPAQMKLRFVFFGKAVSAQLCELKTHHWCDCEWLHWSHWICSALYQLWIILRALKCSCEWLWAHPLLWWRQARMEIEKQEEKARDRHTPEQFSAVKVNPCGGFWDYLKEVVNDSE